MKNKRDRQMKSFSWRPPARDGQTPIFVQLSHLRSNLDFYLTIEAHLGGNSQDFMENSPGGQRPKLVSRTTVGRIQSFEVRFGFGIQIGSQMTSEAVLHKILAISTQMCLNGEVGIQIGPEMTQTCLPWPLRPTLASDH